MTRDPTMGRSVRALFVALIAVAAPVSPAVAESEGTLEGFVWQERDVPDLAFEDGSGVSHTLAEFKGRIVLLNIWATWCPPCREEMPSLDRLQGKLGSEDFIVVPLSIDRGGTDVVEAFYREIGVENLGVFVGRPSVAPQLGVAGIPATLLIARSGKEVGRLIGPAEWDSQEVLDLIAPLLITTHGGGCCPMEAPRGMCTRLAAQTCPFASGSAGPGEGYRISRC